MNLAVGIFFEESFTWSIQTKSDDPQTVANELQENGNVMPDQVLLIKKDKIVSHWNIGEDYKGPDDDDGEWKEAEEG